MYAVVFTYNFSDESSVFIFNDENYAKNFLYESFCTVRNKEGEKHGCEVDSMISVDKTYATVYYAGTDEDGEDFEDVWEFRLCYDVNYIYRPDKYVN